MSTRFGSGGASTAGGADTAGALLLTVGGCSATNSNGLRMVVRGAGAAARRCRRRNACDWTSEARASNCTASGERLATGGIDGRPTPAAEASHAASSIPPPRYAAARVGLMKVFLDAIDRDSISTLSYYYSRF